MRLYLVGYMGSGKSFWGPRLAEALGVGFVDLDAAIEKVSNKRIPDIFREEGEEVFRRLESQVLRSVAGSGGEERAGAGLDGLDSGTAAAGSEGADSGAGTAAAGSEVPESAGAGSGSGWAGVVACGGGTPCRPENWEVMESTGRVVWLRVDEGVLAERLAGTGDGRPVLPANGRDGEALRAHMAERSACYRRAHFVWENPSELNWDRALRGVRALLEEGSAPGGD
jgi:shikimate kinase